MLRTNGPEKTPRTTKQLVHTQESIATSFPLEFENYAHLHAPYFLHCKNPTFFTAVKHYLDFCFVFSAPIPAWTNLYSGPTGLGHRSQITEGPVLKPFSYTEMGVFRSSTYIKHKMHGPTKHKTNVQASHKTKEHWHKGLDTHLFLGSWVLTRVGAGIRNCAKPSGYQSWYSWLSSQQILDLKKKKKKHSYFKYLIVVPNCFWKTIKYLPNKTTGSLSVLSWNPGVLWSFGNRYRELTLNLIFQILVPSGFFDPENFQTPKSGDSLILVFKYPETAGIIKKSNTHLTLVLESSTMALRVLPSVGWFSTFTENLQFQSWKKIWICLDSGSDFYMQVNQKILVWIRLFLSWWF